MSAPDPGRHTAMRFWRSGRSLLIVIASARFYAGGDDYPANRAGRRLRPAGTDSSVTDFTGVGGVSFSLG